MSSPEQDGEGQVADVLRGHEHGVAEALRLALADVVDIGHLGDAAHLRQLVQLAPLLEVVLELEGAVEMVLEAPLAPPGDDQDVGDTDRHCLFHHVLDGRLVDQRQHLLRLGLGRRQEAGTEPRGGDHSLADLLRHYADLPWWTHVEEASGGPKRITGITDRCSVVTLHVNVLLPSMWPRASRSSTGAQGLVIVGSRLQLAVSPQEC